MFAKIGRYGEQTKKEIPAKWSSVNGNWDQEFHCLATVKKYNVTSLCSPTMPVLALLIAVVR